MHYRFRGFCLPIDVLTKRNELAPDTGRPTPAGGYTLVAHRTKLGLIKHRGVVEGKPVAFTSLRSTYSHEIDSGIGFSMFNDPGRITSARGLSRPPPTASATPSTGSTWTVTTSPTSTPGSTRCAPPGRTPTCPTGACGLRVAGLGPGHQRRPVHAEREHPQGVNQDFYTSWNNKQAPGHRASDDFYGYGPVYRSQLLDDRISSGITGTAKMNKVELVQAMQDAATVDLRGDPCWLWLSRSSARDRPELPSRRCAGQAESLGGHRALTASPAEPGTSRESSATTTRRRSS